MAEMTSTFERNGSESVTAPSHTAAMTETPGPDSSARMLEATAVLLTDDSWRRRVIEQMRPVSVDHYELRRSFQFEIPESLFDKSLECDDQGNVEVLLPVCWLPKESLLDFDLRDQVGKPAPILERRSIGGALTTVLDAWQRQIPEMDGIQLSESTIESICSASLSPWHQAHQRRQRLRRVPPGTDLSRYLEESTGFLIPADASAALLEKGRQLTFSAFEVLGKRLNPEGLDNTAFSGAVLAPYSTQTYLSTEELVDWIDIHHHALERIIIKAKGSDAVTAWLELLVESGRRWPALVPSTVPIGRPFLYKTREIRSSGSRRPRIFRHRADLASAQSYHIAASAPDPSMRIRRPPEALADDNEPIGAPGTFESFTWSDELFSAYSSLSSRPEQVTFTFTFGLYRDIWFPYVYAILLVAFALGAAVTQGVNAAFAAVLTIPTAIVGGFVVSRDSVLLGRLLRWPRILLMSANLTLWVIVLWKLQSVID